MLFHRLAGIFLAPIFLVEGYRVRQKTPRLPEPEGARSGEDGEGPEIRLLILGDSAAAGVGVRRQEEALAGKLVAALAKDHCVFWKLNAQNGMRSEGLLREIIGAHREKFDYAVISIGVNDVTHGTGTEIWKSNMQIILHLVERKFQVGRIFLTSIPPVHRFPALPQPLRWWLGRKARLFNEMMEKSIQKDKKITMLNLEMPFERHYMAEDGFHPSEAAYTLWGEAVATAIRKSERERS